ncbi:MAG: discoidin domain-containing protein, partial [Bacteroidaceae bacterium]|nr:discoidin domain-containing protein [Bacteroidaceae bacterium]
GGKRTFSTLKFTLQQNNALYWSVKEVTLMRKGKPVRNVYPALYFSSVWKAPKGAWAYVDLGAKADVEQIRLHWLAEGMQADVQVSDDARAWTPVKSGTSDGKLQLLNAHTKARYVRVTNTEPACLSELEVYGRNGLSVVPQPEQGWLGSKYMLNGGDWTLCPVSAPSPSARQMGPEITATVPATVLSSYHNAGALPNPNTDDNLSMVSESFFNRDFLYTRTFTLPENMKGKRVLLNFDGINWKAHVYLNGQPLGKVEGAFIRGQFDITDHLKPENKLCVYIQKNDHPGALKVKTEESTSFNGGVLGADNPTFHATIGWDWITTIPGRDHGIWNDVYLTATESVTIADPIVTTHLNEGLATMTPSVFVKNHLAQPVQGVLKGFIGDIQFEKEVSLSPKSETEIVFLPQDYKQLSNQQMQLWWPNGYGTPHTYRAGYEFLCKESRIPTAMRYNAGIREVTYKDVDTRLQLYINGQRFIPLGGNWGFSENHLNYRGREYDIAVDYHRQMNYTMIRNWVGQTGDEEFYEACDRHGIMVWQDFWLANPVDGPNPYNEPMFMANASDYVRRIRKHPSIALYCGRNEGYPPESLNKQLRETVALLSPGALYFPSSADDGVSGHGPYRALPAEAYFKQQTGKLHSERGMPNVPNIESLRRMLAPEHLWPQNPYWGKHDFTQKGAQAGATFNQLVFQRFGANALSGVKDPAALYAALAQWQNYDGYRAMYESSNLQRQGLIIWMSHSCWPSMVWQTYDYYFEPTAAFFGVKKACEPIHVQYNAATKQVQMVNLMKADEQVKVTATLYDLKGKELWKKSKQLYLPTDTTADCFGAEQPTAGQGTCILRLQAYSKRNNILLSTNTYLLSATPSQEDLWKVPQASVEVRNAYNGKELVIVNTGSVPAFMVRLKLCSAEGEQILPIYYSDNYFHLLPGERKTINIGWKAMDIPGTLPPLLHVSGFNVPDIEYKY